MQNSFMCKDRRLTGAVWVTADRGNKGICNMGKEFLPCKSSTDAFLPTQGLISTIPQGYWGI